MTANRRGRQARAPYNFWTFAPSRNFEPARYHEPARYTLTRSYRREHHPAWLRVFDSDPPYKDEKRRFPYYVPELRL